MAQDSCKTIEVKNIPGYHAWYYKQLTLCII